jgi:hypothetical protein
MSDRVKEIIKCAICFSETTEVFDGTGARRQCPKCGMVNVTVKYSDYVTELHELTAANEELRREVERLTNQLAEEETNTNFYINGYADLKEKLVAEIELSRAAGEAYHLMKIRAERAERELGELKSK